MAKGGRSRYTKRPVPVVKRAAASPLPKPSAGATPTSVAKLPTTPARVTGAPRAATAIPEPAAAPAKMVATATRAIPPHSPLSPVEQWISAFTRGFPYVLAEYCLFLLAVFAGPAVALVVGGVLVSVFAVNRATRGMMVARLPANLVHAGEALLGRRDDVLASLGTIGASLLSWVLWKITSIMLFSWLSIVALLAALFLLFYAQRLHTPRET